MRIKAHLATQFKVTTLMVLSSKLLRLSAMEVEQAITQELTDNPALEDGKSSLARNIAPDPSPPGPGTSPGLSHSRRLAGGTHDLDDVSEYLVAHVPVLDQLINQVRLIVPPGEVDLAIYLIRSLDQHGLLRTPEDELAQELDVTPERLAQHIAWLHQLEPTGIGARNVCECFLLQCVDLEARGLDCKAVRQILSQAWEPFIHQRWPDVARLTGLSQQAIDAALGFMRDNLYPYPLQMVPDASEDENVLAYPDLVIHPAGRVGRFSVQVPAAQAHELAINPAFQMAIRGSKSTDSELEPHVQEWVAQSVERARMLIDAVEQRWTTLRRIGEFLVEYQSDFFQRGPRHLLPLTRAEVAQQLGLHESTISRAVSDKVLQLPNGRLVELCDLFDGSLAAKEAIRELATRDEPLSDREIALQLQSESFDLSRRTIAKYREQLGIPTKGHRKRVQGIRDRHT
jgi:RNA polymerase sigma-54 factor